MRSETARARTTRLVKTRDTGIQNYTMKLPSPEPRRIEALDLARGFAIALMILSHGVKGLLSFETFPTWGLVPIHLVTKFSSSLFILVFGMSLAVAFLPSVNTASWPEKRRKLLLRGLTVLFWYKALTIVEMFHLAKREDILQTLKYQAFPVYVEILGFYGLALLWIPFALSLWKYLPFYLRVLVPVGFLALSNWLTNNPHVFSSAQMQAIFVEHDNYYTWGQISRAPLIFLGVLIGEFLLFQRSSRRFPQISVPQILIGTGVTFFLGFCYVSWPSLSTAFQMVALNKGKHPPELGFMLFSLSGAFLILGCSLSGGNKWAHRLKPITWLGKDSLGAFIFHAVVLFVFYRYLFDLWLKVTYGKALMLALLLIAMSAVWVKTKEWVSKS